MTSRLKDWRTRGGSTAQRKNTVVTVGMLVGWVLLSVLGAVLRTHPDISAGAVAGMAAKREQAAGSIAAAVASLRGRLNRND